MNQLTLNEYQDLATRTGRPDLSREELLAMTALGLGGESGEVIDMIKKHLFHGHDLDQDKISKELGDVFWYIAAMAAVCGLTLEDIAKKNVAKLEARYPGGFSVEASKNRTE
jgi:NTP pyrophosphatase (non-canonical NTP hydrolase)